MFTRPMKKYTFLIHFSKTYKNTKIIKLEQIKASKKEVEVDTNPEVPDHKDNPCDICDYCEEDFRCLSYLKTRAKEIESKEALDLVIQLNTLLFTGKHVKDQ